jgi:hypothetical protein
VIPKGTESAAETALVDPSPVAIVVPVLKRSVFPVIPDVVEVERVMAVPKYFVKS